MICDILRHTRTNTRFKERGGSLDPADERWLRIPICAVPFCRQTPLTLKALRAKDYSENLQTLGQHLKKRRRELGLLQREAAEQMSILTETYASWENDKTVPVAAQFQPVVEFLGYDHTRTARTLPERLQAKRRALGVTFSQVARHFGWDEGSLTRYLNGTWRMSPDRAAALEAILAAETADLIQIHRLPRRH